MKEENQISDSFMEERGSENTSLNSLDQPENTYFQKITKNFVEFFSDAEKTTFLSHPKNKSVSLFTSKNKNSKQVYQPSTGVFLM
jgi:hypothetical protein